MVNHEFKEQCVKQIIFIKRKCNLDFQLRTYTETSSLCKFDLTPGNSKIKDITKYEDEFQSVLGDKTSIQSNNGLISILVPKPNREVLELSKVLYSNFFRNCPGLLKIAVGEDTDGRMVIGDLTKWVNLLVAGEPGGGKSIFLHCAINSLIQTYEPSFVRLFLADSKKVELTRYENIKHLYTNVCCSITEIYCGLSKLVKEMNNRYDLFKKFKCRDIKTYQSKIGEMPFIVVIVDELANIILKSKEIEELLVSLAQMGRAAGIHLILATQKPSSDIITPLIKANVPTRIAFSVASHYDSMTILDCSGAEKLNKKGDMLLKDEDGIDRIQCAFISDEEIESVVNELIEVEEVTEAEEPKLPLFLLDLPTIEGKFQEVDEHTEIKIKVEEPPKEQKDERLEKIIQYIKTQGKCNAWMIKQYLKVGNTIANEMIEKLQSMNIISKEKIGVSYQIL